MRRDENHTNTNSEILDTGGNRSLSPTRSSPSTQSDCANTFINADEEDVASESEAESPPTRFARNRHRTNVRRPELYPPRRQRRARQDGRSPISTRSVVEILQLANEVEDLRRRRDELMGIHVERLLNSGRRDFLVTTALEYYDTFSDGFQMPRLPDIHQYMTTRIDQTNFTYGATALSIDTWVEQWHRYTHMFPSIAIRVRQTNCMHLFDPLDAMDASTTTSIVEARGTMTGVISRQAINTILPHLCDREDLVEKLLHQPLNCPITLRFYFSSTGRIIRLDYEADFFQAFSNVTDVGLFEVMYMMERATIRDSSLVPEVVEVTRATDDE